MSRQDPAPLRQASRSQTYADLVAEAEAVFTDEAVANSNRGIHPAFGHNTRKGLVSAYIGIRMTPAMRAERDAARRAEFGPLGKDVHRGSAL